jgi:elongation factor Ts
MISSDQVKKLREETDFSIMECKKALEEAEGDMEKAKEALDKKGAEKAAKKADREAVQGRVESYVHGDGKSGVMLQLFCESDFVAKNDQFKELAHDIAMHVLAMDPNDKEDLLSQPFIKNEDQTIEELINEAIGKLGENIKIGEFVKLKI